MPCGPAAARRLLGMIHDGEQLIVVQEVQREALRDLDVGAVTNAIREAVTLAHELRVAEVYLIRPGTIPKTSSGKIQRRACRAQLLAGELELAFRSDSR